MASKHMTSNGSPSKRLFHSLPRSLSTQDKGQQDKQDEQKMEQSLPVRLVCIPDDRAEQRLDNFLVSQLKGAPKSLIYRVVRTGQVRVNKGRVKPSYKLKAGDLVRLPPIKLTPAPPSQKVPKYLYKWLPKAVLYESDGLMILNKPAGIAVHGGTGITMGLIESLQAMYPQYKNLELVHRLDRDTSGCLMVAKKRSILRTLHAQLRNKNDITKRYHALVAGGWSAGKSTVKAPLLRYHLNSGERMVKVDPEGKFSHTDFWLLKSFGPYTLIECQPFTGRTHQIRVHCQYRGHPVINDAKYGHSHANQLFEQRGLKRMFLHAYSLHLTDPSTKQAIQVQAPYDDYLHRILSLIE